MGQATSMRGRGNSTEQSTRNGSLPNTEIALVLESLIGPAVGRWRRGLAGSVYMEISQSALCEDELTLTWRFSGSREIPVFWKEQLSGSVFGVGKAQLSKERHLPPRQLFQPFRQLSSQFIPSIQPAASSQHSTTSTSTSTSTPYIHIPTSLPPPPPPLYALQHLDPSRFIPSKRSMYR